MRSLVGNNGSQPIFLVATSISCEDFLERSGDHLSWAHKVNWDQMHGWIDASWQHLATQPATFGGKTHHCAKPVLACVCVCVHAYVQIHIFLFIYFMLSENSFAAIPALPCCTPGCAAPLPPAAHLIPPWNRHTEQGVAKLQAHGRQVPRTDSASTDPDLAILTSKTQVS